MEFLFSALLIALVQLVVAQECTQLKSVGPGNTSQSRFENNLLFNNFAPSIRVFQKITLSQSEAGGLCRAVAFFPTGGVKQNQSVEVGLYGSVGKSRLARPGLLLATFQLDNVEPLPSHPADFVIASGVPDSQQNIQPGEYWVGLRGPVSFAVGRVNFDVEFDFMASIVAETVDAELPTLFPQQIVNLWSDSSQNLRIPFFFDTTEPFENANEISNNFVSNSTCGVEFVGSVNNLEAVLDPSWRAVCEWSPVTPSSMTIAQSLQLHSTELEICTIEVLVKAEDSTTSVEIAIYEDSNGLPSSLLALGKASFSSILTLESSQWVSVAVSPIAEQGVLVSENGKVWVVATFRGMNGYQIPTVNASSAEDTLLIGYNQNSKGDEYPSTFSYNLQPLTKCGDTVLEQKWPIVVLGRNKTALPSTAPTKATISPTISPTEGPNASPFLNIFVRFRTTYDETIHGSEAFKTYIRGVLALAFQTSSDDVVVVSVKPGSVVVHGSVKDNKVSLKEAQSAMIASISTGSGSKFGLGSTVTVEVSDADNFTNYPTLSPTELNSKPSQTPTPQPVAKPSSEGSKGGEGETPSGSALRYRGVALMTIAALISVL